MIIISLLTAFGLGTVIAALIQSWLSRKSQNEDRRFKEKQSAYIGLLEAYRRAAIERTDEAGKHFAYWQMRCALVAPKPVRDAIQRVKDTNDDISGRASANEQMEAAMRSDLGVTK